MIFSEFVATDHWLSRVDGRVKILVSLVLLGMVLSYRGFAFHLLVTALCLYLCRSMKVPWRTVLVRFSEPLAVVLVILLLKVFFSGGEGLFSVQVLGMTVTVSREGLAEGLLLGSRILAAVSLMAVLVLSMPFTELMAALSWLKVPRGFVEILLYAYRYIFVLHEDAGVIYSAQRNRLGYATFRRRFRSLGVLTGSLILKAFEHSQTLTTAMIQRGYDGRIPLFSHKPLRRAEVLVSILVVTAMGILWKM